MSVFTESRPSLGASRLDKEAQGMIDYFRFSSPKLEIEVPGLEGIKSLWRKVHELFEGPPPGFYDREL